MASKPYGDEADMAVIDAVFSAAANGHISRSELEERAIRPESFANVALDLYQRRGGTSTDRIEAVETGCRMLAAESITWLLETGRLREADGKIQLTTVPLKVKLLGHSDGKTVSYIPGSQRENDLFHQIRRPSPARLALLRESIAELGDLRDYFPVLEDTEGNIVDGRHRRAIDPEWPAARPVQPEDRLAVALAANRTNAWTERDWARLLQHRTEAGTPKRQAQREIIRLALLEDPARSDRAIGELTGCSHHTVIGVRRELESSGQLAHYLFAGGQTGGKGRKAGTLAPCCAAGQHVEGEAAPPPAEPPRAKARARSKPRKATPELHEEVRERVQAGQPVPRSELAKKHHVGESTIQDTHIYERGREEGRREAAGTVSPVRHRHHGHQWEADRWHCGRCGQVTDDLAAPHDQCPGGAA